ncbi:MAG: LptA/OstA family protein [candidate division KSB1 bacterium]|jgi:lipopolysaccharide export system protein LptA|nr:LptA/OstA family protein [candidate division KSB1 bacterium]
MKQSIMTLLFALLATIQVLAQDKLEFTADTMRGETSPNGPVRILEGNVHLKQGDANLYCEYAKYFSELNETILERDVEFVDPDKTITSEKVYYFDLERTLKAVGNVVFVDSVHKMCCDVVTYHKLTEHVIASDNVVMTESSNEVVLTGEHAEYFRNDGYAFITGSPVLTKKDSTQSDEIVITGKKMEIMESGDRAVVTDSVRIDHTNGKAECNKAEYFRAENRLLLLEDPVVWQNRDRLAGDEIELFFIGRSLKQVVIRKNAFVNSPVDSTGEGTRMNKLQGDKITMSLKDNKLHQVEVEGKATSFYHILEDNDYKGMNKIIGDKIRMELNENEIIRIIIESDPEKSSGTYFPPEMVARGR